MVRRIVIKFGGALITKKDEECVAHLEIIRDLCEAVHSITNDGIQVILVHGAGSFGHLKAKRWRLNEGYLPDLELSDDFCQSQFEAVESVRGDMLNLNKIVVTWAWAFLTSDLMKAVRGQKHHYIIHMSSF